MRKFLFFVAVAVISLTAIANNPYGSASTQRKLIAGDYKPGVIIIKLKPEARDQVTTTSIRINSLNEKLSKLGVSAVSKRFLHSPSPSMLRNKLGSALVDLSLIYTLKCPENIKMEEALMMLKSDPSVEYAEPEYVNHLCYQPSDPKATSTDQYYLTNIKAYQAWDIWKGDTNTVIGIVDSGTDWDHPDLQSNIKYNWADPLDGVDNDGDGFKDNFRGWDVSENDNNPMVALETHGAHVCGDAAAVTDNNFGVASPAFKCKFLPVKCAKDASTSSIDNGYDGVTYAADHGVQVINLSWGRSGGYSQFEQDVINYAAVNHDVTVVAAAGNNGADEEFYPASYEHVVSVAATGQSDVKAGFSNYNYQVDVCAPGVQIYSTVYNNAFAAWDGTSMASPVAAGCAAMIKSRFPSFNADQVAEQLRVTSDNIYYVSGNSGYSNKLGKGRVNLYNAVTDVTSPGVVARVANMTDNNDDAFVGNDTIRVTAVFKNLLRPTTNLTCTLTAASNQVIVLSPNNYFTVGALNTLDSVSNVAMPFLIRVKTTAPLNLSVPVKITMNDGTWSDFLSFTLTVNVDYVNVQENDISTTISSKGMIGYNSSGQSQGLGFTYKGSQTTLYEMGLMIGSNVHQVSDAVRNDGSVNNGYDQDFASALRVTRQSNILSDFYANGRFNEAGITASDSLGLLISHNTYAWSSAGDRNYVIVEFNAKNVNTSTFSNIYAGLFADWDVPEYADNKGNEDAARRMGYVYSTDSAGLYCGIKLLSHTAGFKHYSIDNISGGHGGMNLFDGLSNAEKYTALSTNRSRAGDSTATGNDIIDVVSSGPFSLAPNDSFTVAFALIAGENLATIQAGADASQLKYDALTGIDEISALPSGQTLEVFPNPAGNNATVRFSLNHPSAVELCVYSAVGQKVKQLLSDNLHAGSYSLNNDLNGLTAGMYYIRLKTSEKTESKRLMIIK